MAGLALPLPSIVVSGLIHLSSLFYFLFCVLKPPRWEHPAETAGWAPSLSPWTVRYCSCNPPQQRDQPRDLSPVCQTGRGGPQSAAPLRWLWKRRTRRTSPRRLRVWTPLDEKELVNESPCTSLQVFNEVNCLFKVKMAKAKTPSSVRVVETHLRLNYRWIPKLGAKPVSHDPPRLCTKASLLKKKVWMNGKYDINCTDFLLVSSVKGIPSGINRRMSREQLI